jgi:hypothetical protein
LNNSEEFQVAGRKHCFIKIKDLFYRRREEEGGGEEEREERCQ